MTATLPPTLRRIPLFGTPCGVCGLPAYGDGRLRGLDPDVAREGHRDDYSPVLRCGDSTDRRPGVSDEANAPADLVWTQDGDTRHRTTHDGQEWAIVAHSSWLGKGGWSGTNEWHLDPPGRCLISAGKGTRITKAGAERAKQLAAWILANQALADRMTMREIHEVVFGSASRDGKP